jgi:hypothetical protein
MPQIPPQHRGTEFRRGRTSRACAPRLPNRAWQACGIGWRPREMRVFRRRVCTLCWIEKKSESAHGENSPPLRFDGVRRASGVGYGRRFSSICESPCKLCVKSATKKPVQQYARAGFAALASFIKRQQAEFKSALLVNSTTLPTTAPPTLPQKNQSRRRGLSTLEWVSVPQITTIDFTRPPTCDGRD